MHADWSKRAHLARVLEKSDQSQRSIYIAHICNSFSESLVALLFLHSSLLASSKHRFWTVRDLDFSVSELDYPSLECETVVKYCGLDSTFLDFGRDIL